MSNRVFVIGVGIVCAIGNNAKETLTAIQKGKSGIQQPVFLETAHRDILAVAEVKYSNDELKTLAGLHQPFPRSRTTLLGMIAAKEAAQQAGILTDWRTGLVSANTVGGMEQSEAFYPHFLENENKGKLRYIVEHDCGGSTELLAHHLGITDYVTTISTACSSSANSIMWGARLLKNDMLDCVIAGGTDALTRFTLNGFHSLKIVETSHTGCKPFDEHRQGVTLGEGAAYVVLVSEKALKKSGKQALCELKGYGNANDAHHQTASSEAGNGAFLAMQKALKVAGLTPQEIDYVNAHGTGTPNNDLSEGNAMQRLFGEQMPPFSSTKPFTGHCLGAAGGIEAVLSVLAIQHHLMYPNLNYTTPMQALSMQPLTELVQDASVHAVLSNSFGFGGNSTSLVFGK